jgi:pilus assembly protein CpaE
MKTTGSKTINVSVLYGTGLPNPEYRELLSSLDNLKILQEAKDPETFLSQHQEKCPDLALVDLDGNAAIPDWLEQVIARLPQTEVMVCSHSRDPDFLIRIMKLRAGGFLPLPLNREELLTTVDRLRAERILHHEPSETQILAVTGTKGGVGTTSIAVNLAVALTEIMPGEVILIDLARPYPHVAQFLDLQGKSTKDEHLDLRHTIKDLLDSADNLDPIFVKKIVLKHESDLEVLPGYSNYNLSSPMVPDFKALAKIFTTLRSTYNWVVVDLGSWLDLFYIHVLQEVDQILLVTELTLPDVQNAKVIKALFQEWGVEDYKLKVLVNHYKKHYALGLKNLENIFLQPVACTLPHEYASLMEAINQGEALGKMSPRSKLWRGLKDLAADLVAQSKPGAEKQQAASGPGLLGKLFH